MRKSICDGTHKRMKFWVEVENGDLFIYWDKRYKPGLPYDYSRRHLTIPEMRTYCTPAECAAAAKEANYQFDRCWEDL